MTSLKYIIEQENNLLRKLEWVDTEISEREKQRRNDENKSKYAKDIGELYTDRDTLLMNIAVIRAEMKGYLSGILGMINYE